jgi:hypothetical protein
LGLVFVIAVPSAEVSGDPGEPSERTGRTRVFFARRFALERRANGFGRTNEILSERYRCWIARICRVARLGDADRTGFHAHTGATRGSTSTAQLLHKARAKRMKTLAGSDKGD